MSIVLRARFDGTVILPEQHVELPTDRLLEIEVTILPDQVKNDQTAQTAWDELKATAAHGLNLPDEALRREAIYEN
ncbi:MAG: hypothetical protein KIT45_12270 [Fimbriimonadia bacterium]|nr:hypothetical protein [Fimbriimonadia bacterium]